MKLILSTLITSIVQLTMFTIIPLIWWVITAKKDDDFFHWIGFRKIKRENIKLTIIMTVVTSIFFMVLSMLILKSISGVKTTFSEFNTLGVDTIVSIIITAVIKTALSEEIIFRGFLLKRLENKFGFKVGNIIQGIVFGLLHGVMFINLVNIPMALLIILYTFAIAYTMGYINEKRANGSILPSWIIHSVANIFAGFLFVFNVI